MRIPSATIQPRLPLPGCAALALLVAWAVLSWAGSAGALAASGPQYGTIGQYGEVWRGGGFDACWYDEGRYDGAGASHGVAGCAASESQPAPGKFIDPVGFAVDTQDQTPGGDGTAIYVLDRTSNLPGKISAGRSSWRLQKLDDQGQVLGTSQFTLPLKAPNASTSGVFDYEMLGLAVDPLNHMVYALVVAFCDNVNFSGCSPPPVQTGSTEYADEILAWSTAPAGGQLPPAPGLPTDKLSAGANGFPTPAVLSTASQLSSGGAPEADGSPQIVQPEGLAVDSTGGDQYLAVESADATANTAGAGITQVCASKSCAACPATPPTWVTCYDSSPTAGDIRLQWSAIGLQGLYNDNGDALLPPAGVSTVPAGSTTAVPGSLTVLLDEQSGSGPGLASNLDVVNVPADLTDPPAILASEAPTSSVAPGIEDDDAATATSDQSPETPGGDPDTRDGGPIAATKLASPQIVPLANGLYAGEFEPDRSGQADPQDPDGQPGLWTAEDPGVRLVQPLANGTLSNDPTTTMNPPLSTLFDTLGNPRTNQSGSTDAGSACNLSDAVSAVNGVPSFPSLAAGAGGTLWVLTRGVDSSGLGFEGGSGGVLEGGRYLIELSPSKGDPCPAPTGTFTVTAPGGSAQPASTSSPLDVTVGSTVTFDACPPATQTYANCPPTGTMGINTLGSATAAYVWSFGDGTTDTIATVPGPKTNYLWPSSVDTHQYKAAGKYTVTLTMLGDFGSYVESGTIQVASGILPAASFTYSTAPLTINVDASASTPSPGQRIISYQWNWGDGQIDDAPGPTDSHTYSAAGTYTVTLSVLDSSYAHSPTDATATMTITAPPTPPPASSAPPAASPAVAITPGPPAVTASVLSRAVKHGRISLLISCPAGQTRCQGNVLVRSMRTLAALLHDPRKGGPRYLVLGEASFRLAGGATKQVSIRLPHEALKLLAKSALLWATVKVKATNPQDEHHAYSFRLALQRQQPHHSAAPTSPANGGQPTNPNPGGSFCFTCAG